VRGGECSGSVEVLLLEQSMDLADERWEALDALIPEPTHRVDGRGRPPRDPGNALKNGIL
jgi:hypothetical protein